MSETVRVALSGLAANKLRSGLTILGLMIGVGSVIVLIAVGTGSSSTVQQQIDALESNVLEVASTGALGGFGAASTGTDSLTVADADALKNPFTAPDVASSAPACGSSSSPQSSTSSSSSSSGSAASAATGRAELAACLKQHGVTLPTRPSGAKPPSGGYGPGGGGFFGGGGGAGRGGSAGAPNGNSAQATKFRDAMKAYGANFGGGRPGAGAPGGAGARPSAAALASFSSCVAAHGYKLPKPNTSGNGPICPRKIESNKTFEAAAKACQSHLRPSAGGSGSGGSSE